MSEPFFYIQCILSSQPGAARSRPAAEHPPRDAPGQGRHRAAEGARLPGAPGSPSVLRLREEREPGGKLPALPDVRRLDADRSDTRVLPSVGHKQYAFFINLAVSFSLEFFG